MKLDLMTPAANVYTDAVASTRDRRIQLVATIAAMFLVKNDAWHELAHREELARACELVHSAERMVDAEFHSN